jgi:dolichol-phosphate mannosyltransferase
MIKLSLVIPVFDEEKVLPISIPIILQNLEFLADLEFEVIIVDDGSKDTTLETVMELQKEYSSIRLISMQGNHGHMRALEAGMRAANGRFVATMDCDLQDPPSALHEMYKIISETGVSCVQAVRMERPKDSIFKRSSAAIFYRVIRTLTGVSVIQNAADYRILSRETCLFLCELPEKKKVFRLLIPYFGINVIEYPIIRDERVAGRSKYNLGKMTKLAVDSCLSFSTKPLRLILHSCLFSIFFSILIGLYAVYEYSSGGTIPGWTSITLLIIFLFSILLYSIAAVGEYVGRIYSQVLDRPSLLYKEII